MNSPHSRIANLPNALTTARLGLAVVLFACVSFELWSTALAVFIVAAITDWLDGFIARKQGLTSAFGRNFDPLVDKVLVTGAFIFLMPVPGARLAPWMVTLVVARELLVTGLRSFFESRATGFGADWFGKVKMVLQCAALIAILLSLARGDSALVGWQAAITYAMLAATGLSGLQYVVRAVLIFMRG